MSVSQDGSTAFQEKRIAEKRSIKNYFVFAEAGMRSKKMVNTVRAVNVNKCTDNNTRIFEKYTEKMVERYRI